MANIENAIRMKNFGRLIFKLGLSFSALGVFAIFLGALSAGMGSIGILSLGHLAVLAGVAVALNLGLLPAIAGGILWLVGVVREARVSHAIPNQSPEDQEKTRLP